MWTDSQFLPVSCFLSSTISCRTYRNSVWLWCIMLWMKWKIVVDSLRGRRRRLPCSLWFLLLFAAGGLLLFIHQQDLSEMVQQPGPGQSKTLSPSHLAQESQAFPMEGMRPGLWLMIRLYHKAAGEQIFAVCMTWSTWSAFTKYETRHTNQISYLYANLRSDNWNCTETITCQILYCTIHTYCTWVSAHTNVLCMWYRIVHVQQTSQFHSCLAAFCRVSTKLHIQFPNESDVSPYERDPTRFCLDLGIKEIGVKQPWWTSVLSL